MPDNQDQNTQDICPKCSLPLSPVVQTPSGRQLRRCSGGLWNPDTKKTEGCDFVKWLQVEPQVLDEKCPKCGAVLMLQFTRFGKKMKKCSNGGWDQEQKKAVGCDYVEWINGSTQPLSTDCPECGEKLVLFTTSAGKRLEKCSTAGWDKVLKQATGCAYVRWLKKDESVALAKALTNEGEEFLPPEEN